jgi:hypothetical protein
MSQLRGEAETIHWWRATFCFIKTIKGVIKTINWC